MFSNAFVAWATRPSGPNTRSRKTIPFVRSNRPTNIVSTAKSTTNTINPAYLTSISFPFHRSFFCQCLDVRREGRHEPGHVPPDEELVDDRTDRSERDVVGDLVGHHRLRVVADEPVLVTPALERALLHLVDEVVVTERCDQRGHPDRDDQLLRLPRHVISQRHGAGRHAADGALARTGE